MKKDIEIEILLFETSWKLHGLINDSKEGKLLRDFFYTNNFKSKESIELIWQNNEGKVISNKEYLNLGDNKKFFCEFYEWIGFSSQGKLQGNIQQWYRNGNKRFDGNYVDGKRHGEFKIYKESGEEEYYGIFENGELLETNYGFQKYKLM